MFSKITFLKSVHSKEKDEACLGFLEEIFTKSVHRGGVSSARFDPVQLGSAPSLLIDDLKTDRSVVIQLILRSLVLNGQIVDISWVLFQFGILPNAKVLMLLKFPEHQNYEKKLQSQ